MLIGNNLSLLIGKTPFLDKPLNECQSIFQSEPKEELTAEFANSHDMCSQLLHLVMCHRFLHQKAEPFPSATAKKATPGGLGLALGLLFPHATATQKKAAVVVSDQSVMCCSWLLVVVSDG